MAVLMHVLLWLMTIQGLYNYHPEQHSTFLLGEVLEVAACIGVAFVVILRLQAIGEATYTLYLYLIRS